MACLNRRANRLLRHHMAKDKRISKCTSTPTHPPKSSEGNARRVPFCSLMCLKHLLLSPPAPPAITSHSEKAHERQRGRFGDRLDGSELECETVIRIGAAEASRIVRLEIEIRK